MSRLSVLLLLGALLAASGNKTVQAQVLNAGFEEPVLADGQETTFADGSHWKLGFVNVAADPTLWVPGGDDGGVWNPDAGSGFTDGAAFAGQNTGWAISHTGFDAGMSQILSDTLQADTEYVLSVQVGNAFYNESDETAPYRIELLAGGVLLQSDTGASPVADTWELHSLTYQSGPDPAQLGQPLEIRLIAVDFTDGGGFDAYEVDFDEVSLSIVGPPVEVPTVTEWGMISLSLLLLSLGVFRLHRRKLALKS